MLNSGMSSSGMRIDPYATTSSGFSHASGMSPTLQRSTYDRTFAPLSNSYSDSTYVGVDARPQVRLRIRRLPRNYDAGALSTLLAFTDCKDSFLVKHDDDKPYLTGVAMFADLAQARDAQERLNGKQNSDHTATMIVEISIDDDHFGSRRNTLDGTNGRHPSTSATSSASSNNIPLVRHNSRYSNSFAYSNAQDVSPPLRSPEASRLQTLFSPTSPVANGISGNSLRNDDLGDDDTQLLSETLPHTRNVHYSGPQRNGNSDMLSSSFNTLSLTTSLSSGHSSGVMSPTDNGIVSPRTYSAVQSPSVNTPPSTMAPNGGWTFTRPRQSMPPANPADQNPPCNTLYVGNLPPNTCEDELKSLFSRQRGYRRLCFRTKHNGPMCFVEFEDINYAAQTLDNLYGTMLTNSVKGGIRLSFSKNPLGVRRDQSGPGSPMSPQSMVSGFSNGSGAPFATANGPPPGLPVPAMRGQPSLSHGPVHSTHGRAYNNGVSPTNPNYTSQMRPQPGPGGYYNPSLNGHLAGMGNGAQHMFGGYPNSTNGGMTNGP